MVICRNHLEADLESSKSIGVTFTQKLFRQKMKEGRLIEVCLSKSGFKKMEIQSKDRGLASLFFFMNPAHAIYFISPLSTRKGDLFIYIDTESYREDSVTLTMRRSLEWSLKKKALRR